MAGTASTGLPRVRSLVGERKDTKTLRRGSWPMH